MIVSREEYDALRVNGTMMDVRVSRRIKGVRVVKPDAEIIEADTSPIGGCGVKVGDSRVVRWRDEPGDKPRGGITVIAMSLEQISPGKWLVRFDVNSKQAAIQAPVYLLAAGGGYTTDPAQSCDPEASAMYSKDVERIVADEQAAKREARKQRLARIKSEIAELSAESVSTSREKKHVKEIEHHVGQLEKLGEAA
ncbi:MAG: hypothetical protein ACPHCI_03915 [Solirubrobacterales bacterium]